MDDNINKRFHLQLIQEVIKRMASNSFLLRGWSITLVIAITTLAMSIDPTAIDRKAEKVSLIVIALFLAIVFWILDAFYLSQERCYRALYKDVCERDEKAVDFSMDASSYSVGRNTWAGSLSSRVFLVFYGSATFLLLIILGRMIELNITFR